MRTLRIFISSPGDVAEERDRARQVVEQLRRRCAGQFDLKAVLWEDLPLQADMSFQQGIDLMLSRDQGIDIAVFILWSRLGSPLGPLIRKPDGSTYRSGTERELDLIMTARRQSGSDRPKILIYTRRDEASFDERLRGKPTDEKNQLIAQKKLVEVFVQEEFHDKATGTNIRAYHSFDHPVSFSQRLRVHLQEMLDGMADGAASAPVWDIEKKGSPFRGLEVFEFEHGPVFFGREDEVLEARRALQKKAQEGCALVLISGASGSGKSSLARAGVLPAVVEYEVDSTVAGWRYAACTPAQLEGDLCGGLARLLASEAVLPELRVSEDSVTVVAEGFAAAPKATVDQSVRPALLRAAQAKTGAVRLLLLVDQLEEMFTDERLTVIRQEQFVSALEALARSGMVWVVTTVRSDFYQHCQRLAGLMRAKEGPGQIDVLPPTADGLRRLIEYPARLAGLTFEQREGISLSDRILNDATAHAELLPLVSYVLRELFERRTSAGIMTFAAYEQLGGVEGALAKRAETIFSALPGEVQNALPAVLRALVSVSGNEEESVVRQRVLLSAFPPNQPARVLVERFVAERFLITDKAADGTATVAVAHEALLRLWNRATQWIMENREFLRVRSRVATRMKEGSRLLEDDPLLEAARHCLANLPGGFSPEQAAFIEDCARAVTQARGRRGRLRQQIIATLSVLFVAAIAAAGWAVKKQREAQAQTKEAQKAEDLERLSNEILGGAFSEVWRLPGVGPPQNAPWFMMDNVLQQVAEAQDRKEAKARVLAIRGRGLLQMGDLTNAEFCQAAALTLRTNVFGNRHPEVSESLSLSAEVLYAKRDMKGAQKMYQEALALEGWKPWVTSPKILAGSLHSFAMVLHRQDNDADAETFFEQMLLRAAQDHPFYTALLFRARGVFHAKCDRWPEASEDLVRAIKANPTQMSYRYLYAILLVRAEKYHEYQALCHEVLERTSPQCDKTTARRNAKICLLAMTSEPDLKQVDIHAERGSDAPSPDSRLVKGWAEFRQNHFAEATNWFQRAMELRSKVNIAPNDHDLNAPAFVLLAMACQHLNQTDLARTYLAQGTKLIREQDSRLNNSTIDIDDHLWTESLADSLLLREATRLIEAAASQAQ